MIKHTRDKVDIPHTKDLVGFQKDKVGFVHTKDLVGIQRTWWAYKGLGGHTKDLVGFPKYDAEDQSYHDFPKWYTDILLKENYEKAQGKPNVKQA